MFDFYLGLPHVKTPACDIIASYMLLKNTQFGGGALQLA